MAQSTAGEVLMAYVTTQVRVVHDLDGPVREAAPDAIHQMRVACRRLRSAVQAYAPLLLAQDVAVLGRELRWIGGVLSPARDTEVLRERFAADAPEPLASTIDAILADRQRDAILQARGAMGGAAYHSLLHRLQLLVEDPPLRDKAGQPATRRLPPYVEGSVRRVERLAQLADDDVLLHDVRKAAKRARYTAEIAAPALGQPYEALAAAMAGLQKVLGEHQDSVVAQDLLRAHPLLADDEQAAQVVAIEEERAAATLRVYPGALTTALASAPTR